MSWTDEETRQVKVVVMASIPGAQNLIANFSVSKVQAPDFELVLTEFLNMVEANEGHVKVDDLIDAETSIPTELNVIITGSNQGMFVNELRAKMTQFNPT